MPFGFRARNTASTVLIDTETVVMALTAKGSGVFATGATPWGTGQFLDVTVSGSKPSIAFACAYRCVVCNVTQSGSDWTYRYYTRGPAGTVMQWWAFDEAELAPGPPAYGMRLRRPSDGAITWHSGVGPMRIVGLLHEGESFSGAGNYAVAPAGFAAYRETVVDPTAGTTDLYTMMGGMAGSGSAQAQSDTYRSTLLPSATGPRSDTVNQSYGAYLVIDVTGL